MTGLGVWLAAFTAALTIGLATASSAGAFETYYGCTLKPSNQWCDGRANGSFDGLGSWDWQEVWYPGTWDNTVTVCERLYRPSTGQVWGGVCKTNYVLVSYGTNTCACWEANAKQISGGPHSVQGHAGN
jgi:hypothetical protein